MIKLPLIHRGRGTQNNPQSRFDTWKKEEALEARKTQFIKVEAKTIINEVKSSDIPFDYSANPYQGCEHGCTYCYARPTHNYWGYSSGLDFETKILVKTNAPQLLRKCLQNPNWKGKTISLSGNTDCYQPAEKEFRLTRQMIEICSQMDQCLTFITKNRLITRDIDILQDMAARQLTSVAISLNSLNEDLRQKIEPRASAISTRLRTIEDLSKAGIPVYILAAPVIPGINDHEIFELVKTAQDLGARDVGYSILRLNYDLDVIFKNWLDQHFPDRKTKVLNRIKEIHGGQLNDSRMNIRMRGQGEYAHQIQQTFRVAKNKYFPNNAPIHLDTDRFAQNRPRQLSLF